MNPLIGEINVTCVVSITAASTHLARLLRRAKDNKEHILLTQQGKGAGVLLDVEEYQTMRSLAQKYIQQTDISGQSEDSTDAKSI